MRDSTTITPFSNLDPSSIFILLAALLLVYGIALGCYRIFFHPLCRFPGPRLAAFSSWYEFYFEVIRNGGGQYMFEIERMHAKYGPIVRITPDEIHIDDPDWFDVLYAGNSEVRDKYGPAAKMSGTSMGVFATVDHDKHRIRRSAISPFFSKRSVRMMQPITKNKVDQLCKTLLEQGNGGRVVELHQPLLAFGTDLICEYALGSSPYAELLPDVAKQAEWRHTICAVEDLTPVLKQVTWVAGIAQLLPSWFWKPISFDLSRLMKLQEDMRAMAKRKTRELRLTPMSPRTDKIPTNIFQAVMYSDMPATEKTWQRLSEEGMELIAAGGETVARTLSAAVFHLHDNPSALEKLRQELNDAAASDISHLTLVDLETLPWLTAVIKETLRISAIISSRLPLISPRKHLTYKQWVIPAGTPVSMTPAAISLDERCYKDARVFLPERWLPSSDGHIAADAKYYVPFSKGSRNCIGMNLAYAELYTALAALIYNFDMELYDTTREANIDHARDCFIGKPLTDRGVKVKLRPRHQAEKR